jgi:TRAP-type C4-dicarboxylate transport system substrate-binding protein
MIPVASTSTRMPADGADLYDGTLTELVASGAAASASHLMLTEHAVECGAVVLSQRWLDGLPEQMRKTVVRMPKDIGADASTATAAIRAKLIEHARTLGLQVHELSAGQRRAFGTATRSAHDALLKGSGERAPKILFAARNP